MPGPHHDEHLFCLRQQLQNQIDDPRKIVSDRDSGLVFSKRRVTQILLIHRCQQERYVGKELLSIFARERRCGTSERHDEVRLGTIGERRSDVVDNRVFGRADKPCGANHDFNDIHGLPDPLAQVDAEVGGCVVVRHVAAVERLQQQHVSNRRLSFARRRSEHKQAHHRGTLESPTDAWHMAILRSCWSNGPDALSWGNTQRASDLEPVHARHVTPTGKSIDQPLGLLQVLNCDVDVIARTKTA